MKEEKLPFEFLRYGKANVLRLVSPERERESVNSNGGLLLKLVVNCNLVRQLLDSYGLRDSTRF